MASKGLLLLALCCVLLAAATPPTEAHWWNIFIPDQWNDPNDHSPRFGYFKTLSISDEKPKFNKMYNDATWTARKAYPEPPSKPAEAPKVAGKSGETKSNYETEY